LNLVHFLSRLSPSCPSGITVSLLVGKNEEETRPAGDALSNPMLPRKFYQERRIGSRRPTQDAEGSKGAIHL